jgi:NADP-dependent 3-hydroxy acid dehydrogenase YdfG
VTTHTDPNISGKVVVITGASSGMGEATARYLAERGATVVLGARRVERLQALVEEIMRAGGKASAVVTDVTDPMQVQALVDTAVEQRQSSYSCQLRSVAGTQRGDLACAIRPSHLSRSHWSRRSYRPQE